MPILLISVIVKKYFGGSETNLCNTFKLSTFTLDVLTISVNKPARIFVFSWRALKSAFILAVLIMLESKDVLLFIDAAFDGAPLICLILSSAISAKRLSLNSSLASYLLTM